jgi:hypothetical protein
VPPTCFVPGNLAANNITQNSADLTWNESNTPPATAWEVEIVPTGDTPTGVGVPATNPYMTTGLTPTTSYDYYVRSDCGQGDFSLWVGPFTFATLIAPPECGGKFVDSGSLDNNYSNGEDTTTVICPDVTGEVVTITFLSFNTEAGWDDLTIYDGPDDTAPNLGTFDGTALPPSFTSTHASGCLTFVFHSDGSVTRPGWEANVLCSLPPTCFAATDLSSSNLLPNSADLAWIDTNGGAPASGWEVEYGPIGFVQGTGTIVAAGTNPFTLGGLNSATEYDYYVRANCGGGDFSFWAGPSNFITACDVFIAPYTQDFENAGTIPICFSQGTANAEDWQFSNDVAAPGHIGNDDDVSGTTTLSGGYFAWVDDSFPQSLATTLETPFVDVSGLTTPALSFYFISHDEGNTHVDFSVDVWDGAAWNIGVFTSAANTAGWEEVFINLSTLTITGPVQARFIVDENNGGDFYDDVAIDDITFGEAPTCFNVTGLTVDSIVTNSVTVSWTDNNTVAPVDGWEIEYGVPGFNQGLGTTVTANTNPFTITGLTSLTDYEFYVRANCGATDGFSNWVGPLQFTTLCEIFVAPYTEDFEDAGNIDACWNQGALNAEDWLFTDNTAFTHIGDGGDFLGTTTDSNGFIAWVDDSATHNTGTTLVSPLVDVSGLTTPALSFFYISNNEGNTNVDFSVDVWDGAAWNVGMFTSSANTSGWEEIFVNLGTLTVTGPIQARFIVDENNGNDFTDDIAIDDVTIAEAPTCFNVTGITSSNITINSVDLAWTDNNTVTPAGGWDIEYGISGFVQGTGTVVNAPSPTASITLTGLSSSTIYNVYVRAVCAGDGTDSSEWVGPFTFNTLDAPPPNDFCVDAIDLIVNSDCQLTVGNNILATNSSPLQGVPQCADPAANGVAPFEVLDVWYKFEVPVTGNVMIETSNAGGMVDSVVAVYTGTCGNLTELDCQDDSVIESASDDFRFSSIALRNLTPGDTLYIRVWSYDHFSQGNIQGQFNICVYGQSRSFGTAPVDPEPEIETPFSLRYFPNPATNTLNLTSSDEISDVSIYNMLGQQVVRRTLTTPSTNVDLDLRSLSSGTYFVRVLIGDKTKTVKVIKE